MAAYLTLARNGIQLVASEVDAVQIVIALAANEVEDSEFADWLRNKANKLEQKPSTKIEHPDRAFVRV